MYNQSSDGYADKNSYLELRRKIPEITSFVYHPWSLSYYNGTTFEPPYELVFDYKGYVSFWDGRRW